MNKKEKNQIRKLALLVIAGLFGTSMLHVQVEQTTTIVMTPVTVHAGACDVKQRDSVDLIDMTLASAGQ